MTATSVDVNTVTDFQYRAFSGFGVLPSLFHVDVNDPDVQYRPDVWDYLAVLDQIQRLGFGLMYKQGSAELRHNDGQPMTVKDIRRSMIRAKPHNERFSAQLVRCAIDWSVENYRLERLSDGTIFVLEVDAHVRKHHLERWLQTETEYRTRHKTTPVLFRDTAPNKATKTEPKPAVEPDKPLDPELLLITLEQDNGRKEVPRHTVSETRAEIPSEQIEFLRIFYDHVVPAWNARYPSRRFVGSLPPKLESVFCRFMRARRSCDPMETVEKAIDHMELGAPSRGRDLMWLFTINERQRVPHIELVASGAYVDWSDAIKASKQAKSAPKTVTHASHRLFKLESWEQ